LSIRIFLDDAFQPRDFARLTEYQLNKRDDVSLESLGGVVLACWTIRHGWPLEEFRTNWYSASEAR
jgi:hypothetical protein